MSLHCLGHLDVPIIRLGAHSSQEDKAHHALYDVNSTSYNEPLVVLIPDRVGEVHNYLQEIHKRGVIVHNSGHLICRLAELDLSSLADCFAVYLEK